MAERIDQLSAAPIAGRFYIVPAVRWRWAGTAPARWWPVIGPKHEDTEDFDFPYRHFHIDVRFTSRGHLCDTYEDEHADLLSRPLNLVSLPEGPPPPILRRMKCHRSEVVYPFDEQFLVIRLNKKYAGQQCANSKFGWICPHRNVQLGSIMPIDGVITCPLHGMRIHAASGKCIGSVARA